MEKIPDLGLELLECIPHERRKHTQCYRQLKLKCACTDFKPLIFDYQEPYRPLSKSFSEEFYSIRAYALVAKYRSAVPQGLSAGEAKIRREAFITQNKKLMPVIIEVCPPSYPLSPLVITFQSTRGVSVVGFACRRK